MAIPFHMRWILSLVALLISFGCLPQPVPQPQPDVTPIVDPQPVPIGNVAAIYVIEETSERTPEIAAVLLDPWWVSSGIKFGIYDKDVPEVASVVQAVSGIKLPAIVCVDRDRKVLYRGELPTSIEGVKKLAGAK